jgi:IclR family transcriptional regulator, pca regulon regulatory protein
VAMTGTHTPHAVPEDQRAREDVVRPLLRGVTVLRAMSRPGWERSRPGDLVHATGLARSTVDRIIATLDHIGYLRFDGQHAALAPPLMELGNACLSAGGLSGELTERVVQLADSFDESVSLAVPDGADVRFIAQATRRRTMPLAFRIGDALPAERCAPGAVFAAAWDEGDWRAWQGRKANDPQDEGFPALPPGQRAVDEADFRRRCALMLRDGWSLDDQLIEPGLIAASVPVRDRAGRIACALSVVSHTSRHDAAQLAERCLPRLREAATEMESVLAAGIGQSGTPEGTDDTDGQAIHDGRVRPAGKDELGSGYLQSLGRGLAVLRALGEARGEGLPLTAIASATGLPRATARRSLLTLETLGYVRSRGRFFRPLPRVLELGYAHLSGLSFAEIVQPHLEQLTERVRQSASVTVLDGEDIQYVARVHTIRIMSVNITLGTRFPAYATAMGRVLLAGLPAGERARLLAGDDRAALTAHTVTSATALAAILDEVAESGYAVTDQELEPGLRSVAVPLRGADGRVMAALNVAQHSGSESVRETVGALLPPLRQTAAAAEADIRTATRHHRIPVP